MCAILRGALLPQDTGATLVIPTSSRAPPMGRKETKRAIMLAVDIYVAWLHYR